MDQSLSLYFCNMVCFACICSIVLHWIYYRYYMDIYMYLYRRTRDRKGKKDILNGFSSSCLAFAQKSKESWIPKSFFFFFGLLSLPPLFSIRKPLVSMVTFLSLPPSFIDRRGTAKWNWLHERARSTLCTGDGDSIAPKRGLSNREG